MAILISSLTDVKGCAQIELERMVFIWEGSGPLGWQLRADAV